MSDAPSAKDLEGAKLNKVKTKEAEGVDEDGKKAFKDVWKKHGGDFAKVKVRNALSRAVGRCCCSS